MSDYVKRTALGGYKIVPGGASDPDCTHVILSMKEYTQLLKAKASAEQESRNARYEADNRIQQEQAAARHRIHAAEAGAAERVSALKQELCSERDACAYQRHLNENLLRIAKERFNADRNLRPKKQHSGFVVISSTEKTHRYKNGNRNWASTTLWETVLQVPYSVDFTEEQARRQIMEELFQDEPLGYSVLEKIGINAVYGKEYAEIIEDKRWCEDSSQFNVMLDWRLRANHKTEYWEIIFFHTKPLGIVPPDMRARFAGG